MKITSKQLRKLIRESVMHHARFETQFINELGNQIQISIEDFGCGSADQLTISMIGPNSETENTITRMEAVVLHQLLGDYLSKTQTSINEGYFTDYAKHSTMNLGQVLRHLRYLTDLPNTPKREALKKRLKWIANDLYYTIIPPQSHHTQEELDVQDQFSYGELLKMGYDPDYFDEMMANASKE